MRPVLDRAQLRAAHCTPASASDRLDDAQIAAQLAAATPAWRHVAGALERSFTFADFGRTMAFVNAVAAVADAQDHHPSLQVDYGRCVVRFNTHSASGVTRNDFVCAAHIDALPAAAG